MKGWLKALRDDRRAIAAVEFAFIAPIFIFMTTGAIDLGYVQLAKAQLHGATQVAARSIIQSKTATADQRKTSLQNQITTSMTDFPKVGSESLTVVIKKYSNFNALNPEPLLTDNNHNKKWDPGDTYTDLNANSSWDEDLGTLNDLGGVGDVIKIEVNYPLKPLFSYNAALFGVNGRIDLKATAIFRNEPD